VQRRSATRSASLDPDDPESLYYSHGSAAASNSESGHA
jgi:hypothetical protein